MGLVDSVALQGYFLSLRLVTKNLAFPNTSPRELRNSYMSSSLLAAPTEKKNLRRDRITQQYPALLSFHTDPLISGHEQVCTKCQIFLVYMEDI